MAENKYFWLRLHEDFFGSKRIKKLRKLSGGDTYTIIYLKMQLLALKTDGVIKFTGLEKTVAEEIALDIDEAPEDVGVTMNYLISVGLIETSDNVDYLLPYVLENTGKEGSSAKRVREYREKQKAIALHCNTDVTECNAPVTQVKQNCYGEIETEKEIEIEIKTNNRQIPCLSDVESFVFMNRLSVSPYGFWKHFKECGWQINGEPVRDWKAVITAWNNRRENAAEVDPLIMREVNAMREVEEDETP